jgi:hypothetical protein
MCFHSACLGSCVAPHESHVNNEEHASQGNAGVEGQKLLYSGIRHGTCVGKRKTISARASVRRNRMFGVSKTLAGPKAVPCGNPWWKTQKALVLSGTKTVIVGFVKYFPGLARACLDKRIWLQ